MALIPARSGSKGIQDKNIRFLAGKPLIAHSIEQALAAQSIQRVIVSTDSEHYAEIARAHGAETPFLRPPEISGDHATDLEVFKHALDWLSKNEGRVPDILVHLRPTHPVRNVSDIEAMVSLLAGDKTWDSVRSVSPADFTPFKMWFRAADGRLEQVVNCDLREPYNQPRQILPKAYQQNACIDVLRSSTVLKMDSMTGQRIQGYVMDSFFDIDTEEEFLRAEHFLRWQKSTLSSGAAPREKLRFVVDIDGVIASITKGNDYTQATPLKQSIITINRLFDAGHRIVLSTARGSATGLDWKSCTETQLAAWGLRYHELHFGKPHADFYIDDKLISLTAIEHFLNAEKPSQTTK